MNSFELNKIIGAILGTLLFVMGVGFLAEAIYSPTARGPGYELPLPEGAGAEGGPVEEQPLVSLGTLLASANAEQGKAFTSKCQSCHNFAEGAGNKQGPELYGVVGRQIASFPGFTYGEALAGRGAAGETWTYEHLASFLTSPKDFAPKTKMSFGGVKNPQDLANLLAYLATLSANPVPFPPPEEAAPAEAAAAAPAAGEAAPAETQPAAPAETQPAAPAEAAPAATAPADGAAAPADGGAMAPAEPVPAVPAQQ